MDMNRRFTVYSHCPPPLNLGKPSRFGGLSEYGQPGCLQDTAWPPQDALLSPVMRLARWNELVEPARRQWPRVTRQDLEWSGGDLQRIGGLLQVAYPISGPEAVRQLGNFLAANGRSTGSGVVAGDPERVASYHV